jgi:hypothetical protein
MQQLVSFAYFRINPPKSAATGALRLAAVCVDAFTVDNGFDADCVRLNASALGS